MRRKAIKTDAYFDKYYLSPKDAIKSIIDSCSRPVSIYETGGNDNDTIVICDPGFIHQIISYYQFNERHPGNIFEDASDIVGQILYHKDKVIIIPRFITRVVSTDRSHTHVITSAKNKEEISYQIAMLNKCLPSSDYEWLSDFGPLIHLGHTHSHPDLGNIGVFPSDTDVKDHSKHVLYNNPMWISHIVDPIRNLMAFYVGENLKKKPHTFFVVFKEDADILFSKNDPSPMRKSPKIKADHIRHSYSLDTNENTIESKEHTTEDKTTESIPSTTNSTEKEPNPSIQLDDVQSPPNTDEQPMSSKRKKKNKHKKNKKVKNLHLKKKHKK